MIQTRVEQSNHPDLALIGAVAARRGDELLIVVSSEVPPDAWVGAVRELVTLEEWVSVAPSLC